MTAHVGLIAAMPTDDLLMVYDDGAEGVCEMVQACVRPRDVVLLWFTCP